MKTIPAIILAAGASGLLIACASDRPIPHATLKLTARTTAADAVNRIAAAKCAREERCKNTDSGQVESCVTAVKYDIDRDFGADKSCENGVSVDDLDQCIAKLNGEDCGVFGVIGDGIQTSLACGSNDLCLN